MHVSGPDVNLGLQSSGHVARTVCVQICMHLFAMFVCVTAHAHTLVGYFPVNCADVSCSHAQEQHGKCRQQHASFRASTPNMHGQFQGTAAEAFTLNLTVAILYVSVQLQNAMWWAIARIEPWLHNSSVRKWALKEASTLIHYEARPAVSLSAD